MNVIASAFAFREEYGCSMQLTKKSDTEKIQLYMKNLVVALCSAKLHNPEAEVMLITNRAVDAAYQAQLESAGIVIREVPFDDYEMPKRFPWALAFYKLKALTYLASQDYEEILLIDNDTVTVANFAELWREAAQGLLLYPVNHSFDHQDRAFIRQDYEVLYPKEQRNIVHYGGEFIAGTRTTIAAFMEICHSVYERIVAEKYPVKENIGDETVLAIAAAIYKEKQIVYEAGAYLFRYWTEKNFYLVSTNTFYNPVCIWHIPSEKDRGFLLLYNWYTKKGSFPGRKKMIALLGLGKTERPLDFYTLKGRLMRKLSYLRSKREKK